MSRIRTIAHFASVVAIASAATIEAANAPGSASSPSPVEDTSPVTVISFGASPARKSGAEFKWKTVE